MPYWTQVFPSFRWAKQRTSLLGAAKPMDKQFDPRQTSLLLLRAGPLKGSWRCIACFRACASSDVIKLIWVWSPSSLTLCFHITYIFSVCKSTLYLEINIRSKILREKAQYCDQNYETEEGRSNLAMTLHFSHCKNKMHSDKICSGNDYSQ